jgi:hypothetical protein
MNRDRRGAMGSPTFGNAQVVPSASRGTQASGEERGGVPNAAAALGCLLGPRDKK